MDFLIFNKLTWFSNSYIKFCTVLQGMSQGLNSPHLPAKSSNEFGLPESVPQQTGRKQLTFPPV